MVDITADPTFELPPTQVPEEVPAEPTAEPVVDIVATPVFELPPTAPADLPDPVVDTVVEVDLAEVVEALAEADAVLVDENNAVIPLATEEAAEMLAAADPWFTTTVGAVTTRYCFMPTGGCATAPAICNHCTESTTPIQTAIDAAESHGDDFDGIITVEPGNYAGNITINVPGLTLYGNPADPLVGAAFNAPTLLGTGVGTGITINVSGVTIQGFIIKNFSTGILVEGPTSGTPLSDIELINNTFINNIKI